MDFDKLRYDLALRVATARLIRFGYDDPFENDCEALLGFFKVCYDKFKSMSDQELSEYFRR